jgi:hypothetical protein
MRRTDKKKWKKPLLLILTRKKPQESILSFCKSVVDPGFSGPQVNLTVMCLTPNDGACFECSEATDQS